MPRDGRKTSDMDSNQPGPSGYVSLHPALDELDERIERRYREQEEKVQAHRTRREVEKVSAQFNKQHNGRDYAAEHATSHWVARHKVKNDPGSGSARNTIPVRRLTAAEARAAPRPGARPSTLRNTAPPAAPVSRPGNAELHQRCDVLNCEVEFSSLGKFLEHTEAHNHSPCHPVRHLENGRCDSSPPIFCCPTCGDLYKSAQSCRVHMEEVGHDHLRQPVPIAGYICLQCFLVFPSAAACLMHQHKDDHRTYLHPLPGDTGPLQPQYLPVPVYEAFLKACHAVPSSVECLNCNKTMADSATLHAHVLQGHQVMSFTEKTPADVWPTLMCDYTCVQCQRLYQNLPPDGLCAVHHCSPTMMGMFVENDCNTTADFILRRSLPHIPLVPGDDNNNDTLGGNDEGGAVGGVEGATGGGEGIETEGAEYIDNSLCIIDDSVTEEAEIVDLTESPAVVNRSLSVEIIGTKSGDGAGTSAPRQIQLTDRVGEDFLVTLRNQELSRAATTKTTNIGVKKGSPVKSSAAAKGAAQKRSTNSTPELSPTEPGKTCDVCASTRWRDPKKGSPLPKCVCDKKKKEHQNASPTSPTTPWLSASAKKRKRKSDEKKASTQSAKKLRTCVQPAPEGSSCEARKSLTKTFNTNIPKRDPLAFVLQQLEEDSDEIEMSDPNWNPRITDHPAPEDESEEVGHQSPLRRSPRLGGKPASLERKQSRQRGHGKNTKRHSPKVSPTLPIQRTVHQPVPNPKTIPKGPAPKVSPNLPSSSHKPRGPSPGISPNLPGANHMTLQQTASTSKHISTGPSTRASTTPPSETHSTLTSSSNKQGKEPPALKDLHKMRHIIFVDFDNWHSFFQKLYQPLPENVFVWGFHGGATNWKEPVRSQAYQKAVARKCFFMNDRCGTRKDAADFAICMHVGRMDERLPGHIPFTILSGDKGFEEIERQMAGSHRRVKVINPHHQQADEIFTLLISMVDV